MDFKLIVTLIVLLLFIVMMLSGKFSFSLVGITCVCILVLSGVLSLAEGFAGFADKNVIMLAGMFGIAGMLGKTSLGDIVKDKLLSGKGGGKSSFKLALTLLVIAAILGQFMTSQTSIIMIMMSFLLVLEDKEVTVSRILLPLTFVMTTWMGKTPIGGPGVTTYILLNQFIEAAGGTEFLDVLTLMKCTFIPGILAILYSAFTYKMLPKRELNLDSYNQSSKQNTAKMPPRNEKIVYIAFVLSVVGLLLSGKLGERAYIFPLVICVVLIYMKVMSGKEYLQMLISGPVIMCATILVVANAVTASGAGNLIGEFVLKVLGGNPSPLLIVSVFGIVTLIMTSFISNTASFMVMVPIACNVCLTAGYDPRAAVVTVFSAALPSVMTPMANTGSAVVYSMCNLNVKEGFLWACPGAVLCLAATIVNSLIVYPM